MAESTHRVEVFRVGPVEPHPNADTLGLITVFDGYNAIIKLDQFKEGDLAAYVPPDSIVPDTEQFAFLGGRRRIRVIRLRGVISQGLVIAAPDGAQEGDDVAELLGITHYEPTEHVSHGPNATKGPRLQQESPPSNNPPKYDVEAFRRWGKKLFIEQEPIIVTEKLHGTNARFTYIDEKFYCGSKEFWRKEEDGDLWWETLKANPSLQSLLKVREGITVYGEIFGKIQKGFSYGVAPGKTDFAVFDILQKNRRFTDWDVLESIARIHNIQLVPFLHRGLFDFNELLTFAEGPSTVPGADHVREGCCVRPTIERYDMKYGRVHLKIVGNGYYETK